MDREPPYDRGDPFPTFDPEFGARPGSGRPASSRPSRRPPRGGGGQPSPWLVGLAIALVLATVSIIAFGLLNGGGDGTAGTTTSTTTPGDGTTDSTGDTSTTLPDDGSATSFTLPGGGTGDGTIVAVGDPIPIGDLKMSSEDIGPLDFGMDGDEVLGRLVSTFGQPTDDTGFFTGSGAYGECPGESIRVVQWGPLIIVVNGEVGSSEFVSYRLDLRYGGISSPTTDISTLSGLRVGDTVGELEATYAQFYIEYVVDQEVGLTFQLSLSQNDEVLLWGPVESQADDARVTGIYSPDSCTSVSTTTTAAP